MKKITCIHFFADVGFATVQGRGVMAPFFYAKEVPVLPWGVVHVTSFRSAQAIGLSRRPTYLVCRRLLPPFLLSNLSFPFAHRVVLNEEAVCPCF